MLKVFVDSYKFEMKRHLVCNVVFGDFLVVINLEKFYL